MAEILKTKPKKKQDKLNLLNMSIQNNKPLGKTSIIITNYYKYDKYLKVCLDSVLNQTLKPFEIILVNELASRDFSEKINLDKYHLDKIKLFNVNFNNVQKSRNFGLKMAKGEYVLFLDADDFLLDNYLEKTEAVLNKNKRIKLVYSNRFNFGNNFNSFNLDRYWKSLSFNLEILKQFNFISLPSLIRKANFKGFDERIRRLQDWEAWLNYLKSNAEAYWLNEPLFCVRIHDDNITLNNGFFLEKLKIFDKYKLLNIVTGTSNQINIAHNSKIILIVNPRNLNRKNLISFLKSFKKNIIKIYLPLNLRRQFFRKISKLLNKNIQYRFMANTDLIDKVLVNNSNNKDTISNLNFLISNFSGSIKLNKIGLIGNKTREDLIMNPQAKELINLDNFSSFDLLFINNKGINKYLK
ncbi:MAG: glycosyltransferase [Candidatus Moranbacteria bacterium]|nr:glycosyltransferase [Candidatus Moranbacteria bacterium]